MSQFRTVKKLHISRLEKNKIHKLWLHVINNGIGEPIKIPIMVAVGSEPGPILGLNAALHGNELNGINVIQRLFRNLDTSTLKGTIVGVLVANVPGLLLGQRRFTDNFDLNRQAPGSENGNPSRVYIYRLIDRIIKQFDFLIDLHTTGKHKENCWHIRADMSDPQTARLARLQNPEVILDSEPGETSLRGYCSSIGIKSLTLELKDPMVFQVDVIEDAISGIKNVLHDLSMIEDEPYCNSSPTIFCRSSRWYRTMEGGILITYHDILDEIKEGEIMADIKNIFGDVVKTIYSPITGIVLAKNTNPICQTGMGIMNIGFDIENLPPLPLLENSDSTTTETFDKCIEDSAENDINEEPTDIIEALA